MLPWVYCCIHVISLFMGRQLIVIFVAGKITYLLENLSFTFLWHYFVVLTDLDMRAQYLMNKGLRDSTHATYNSAQKRYFSFCTLYKYQPLPATEKILCNFVTFLAYEGLAYSTIRVYLASVRSLHIFSGLVPWEKSFKLQLIMKAILAQGKPPQKKLPITFDILMKLYSAPIFPKGFEGLLYRAVCSLLFFGGMRGGEVVSKTKYDYNVDLSLYSITVFGSHIVVNLRRTKTTVHGISFILPCIFTDGVVCGHCDFTKYYVERLRIQPTGITSPLFVNADGTPLQYSQFLEILRNLLCYVGLDPSKYTGHSFRAGLATQAGMKGLSDYQIKFLGRWQGNSYQGYIHESLSQVKQTFQQLLL